MGETYTLQVAGLTRELPICKINENISFAAFIMFGDVELTIACATQLLEKVPEFDVIVTAEAKAIPLAYEMSRQCGKKYIPARKGKKLYMQDPVEIRAKSISTEQEQVLCIDRPDLEYLNGKRVLIVDDVISTGGSLKAMEAIVAESTGTVVGRAAVLAEGEAAERGDILFLAPLPLIG